MNFLRKKWLTNVLALVLLFTMGFKMSVTLISHFTKCNDNFSIEKSAEEGKDTKEELISKADKKLMFDGRLLLDHTHYVHIAHAKPVCRYRLQEVSDPPQNVATPPPNRLS